MISTFINPLILLHIFIPLGSTEIKPLQGKVISGLYYEETSKFIPYTNVVPLLFEFKLKPEYGKPPSPPSLPSLQSSSGSGGFIPANININSNAFQILPRLNCRTDTKYSSLSTMDYYFSCPVMYHLHNFLQEFKANLSDIYPTPPPPPSSLTRSSILSPFGIQENQRFTISKVKFEECDSVIEKMWKGVANRDRDTGFVFYTNIIEKCSNMPVHIEDKISDENQDYTEYFDRMQSNFVSTFFLNSSDPGELINNLIGLQSLQLQSIYSELTRIREAVLSCQNNMIPLSFIKYSRLEKALLDLRPKLLKLRHSMSTQSISKLYKMPIADCLFGGNTLIVQILLPVVRSDANFLLLKVNSPIFLYENRLCQVQLGQHSENMISDDEPPTKYYLYEKNNKMVTSTTCTPGETDLCHIPDQTSRSLVNRCLTSVLNQSQPNPDDIRNYCNLQCEDQPLSPSFSKLIIPVIQRISSSKFVVAINRITSLLIKCEGKPDEMVTPQEYGAVEISLACGCYLMWHSEKFDARMPCANTVVVRHVVPQHMLNRSTSHSRNKFYFVSNLEERINSSLLIKGTSTGLNNGNLFIGGGTGSTEIPTDLGSDRIYKFDDNININETLVGATGKTNSLSLGSDVANGYDFYKASCSGAGFTHVFLWVAVGVETALFLGIALYLYCRIYEMNRKWDLRDRTAVTYSSAAQLTNVYD